MGIDPHDLGVKMNKIKAFISAGHQVGRPFSLPPLPIHPSDQPYPAVQVKICVLSTKKSRGKSQALTLQQTALSAMEALQSLPIVVLQLPSRSLKRPDAQTASASEAAADGDEDDAEAEAEEDQDQDEDEGRRQQRQAPRSAGGTVSVSPSPPPPVYQMEFMITPKKTAAAS